MPGLPADVVVRTFEESRGGPVLVSTLRRPDTRTTRDEWLQRSATAATRIRAAALVSIMNPRAGS